MNNTKNTPMELHYQKRTGAGDLDYRWDITSSVPQCSAHNHSTPAILFKTHAGAIFDE